jgi:hypothetical protein
MDENDHPKGTLLFMLIYLFPLAALPSAVSSNHRLSAWR